MDENMTQYLYYRKTQTLVTVMDKYKLEEHLYFSSVGGNALQVTSVV